MGRAIPGLRELRAVHGWTQAELSARSGLAMPTVSFLERGEPIATTRSLTLLAQALGVPVEELLRRTTVAERWQPAMAESTADLARASLRRAGWRGRWPRDHHTPTARCLTLPR